MDDWVRPRPDRRGFLRDALSALILFAAMLVTWGLYSRLGVYDDPAPAWASALVIAAHTLPLAARRRFPATIAVVVSVAFYVMQAIRVPELFVTTIALFVAIYSLGAWGRNRRAALIVRVGIVIGMLVWVAIELSLAVGDATQLPNISRSGAFSQFASYAIVNVLTNLAYFGAALYFGDASWRSAHQRVQLEARTLELATERERTAAQAVALDRVRIARELHDVVAHHVSVMGVQAGAARRVLTSDPAASAASLAIVEQSARDAVDELHGLLTTLRSDEPDPASDSSSTRGIEQLGELVRSAGIPAELRVIGDPRPVSAILGFTLYRVAQEALTNTRKHGGASATADVRLRYLPHALEIEVTDTGTGRGAPHHRGLGLVGMRERVAAVGGDLEAGPRARGGYLVRALLPETRA